jgi:undecaprenyl-diphosphatase
MSLLQIILLAIVQGVTEFLPVSSSGHLVVVNRILETWGHSPVQDLIEVSIVLHLGTLAAVLVFYRREVGRLLGSDRRVLGLLVVGTIPAAILGVLIKKGLSSDMSGLILDNVMLAGCMFPITAAGLLWASHRDPGDVDSQQGDGDYPQLTWPQTLSIGLLQAFALLPGISRSGATIVAGLGTGLRRGAATTFAFLLAIPAIAGAGVLELAEVWKEGTTGTSPDTLAVGFTISMLVGLVALSLLIRWVQQGRLAMFAYYLIPLGVAVVGWQLAG